MAMGKKDAFSKRTELIRRELNKNLMKLIIKYMKRGDRSKTWTTIEEDIKRLEAFEI